MELVTSWMEEGLRKGHERGLQEGRQEGLQEGSRDEALSLVHRVLRRRLGRLPEAAADRLPGLSIEQLENLLEEAVDFRSEADLEAWFQEHAG